MTDIDKLIEELIRRLRGRPIQEVVTVARKLDNRVSDLYLHKALRKYAADHREKPSRHVARVLAASKGKAGLPRPQVREETPPTVL